MAYIRGLGLSHGGPTLGSNCEVLLLYGGNLMGPCGGPGTHPWGPDLWSELSSNSTDGTRGDTGPTAGRPAGWAQTLSGARPPVTMWLQITRQVLP